MLSPLATRGSFQTTTYRQSGFESSQILNLHIFASGIFGYLLNGKTSCIFDNFTGFYTKLNVWGSLGLNFEYDGGPIIEIRGPIFLYKFWKVVHLSVKARCCPQVSNFEGHVWPPSDFLGGHLKFLRATYYHQ